MFDNVSAVKCGLNSLYVDSMKLTFNHILCEDNICPVIKII